MRSAEANDMFPYTLPTMCYFEVYKNGKVVQLSHTRKMDVEGLIEAYRRAEKKETTIYAVWPGKWRSDLFIIDDLHTFAKAFEIFSTAK